MVLISGTFSDLSIFSSDSGVSSVYENYTNSIIDTVSITEIDFGDILGENYFEDCFKNEVFNPTLTEYCVVPEPVVNRVADVSVDDKSHSEV